MDNKTINKDIILQTLYTQTGELKRFGVERIGLFGSFPVMHAVKALFVKYKQQDHDAGGHAGGKPENIQEAIGPVPVHIPEG